MTKSSVTRRTTKSRRMTRAKSRKTPARRRRTQRASHGGSHRGRRNSLRDKEAMKETREMNDLSNAYTAAYFDGEDTYTLGDSFIA